MKLYTTVFSLFVVGGSTNAMFKPTPINATVMPKIKMLPKSNKFHFTHYAQHNNLFNFSTKAEHALVSHIKNLRLDFKKINGITKDTNPDILIKDLAKDCLDCDNGKCKLFTNRILPLCPTNCAVTNFTSLKHEINRALSHVINLKSAADIQSETYKELEAKEENLRSLLFSIKNGENLIDKVHERADNKRTVKVLAYTLLFMATIAYLAYGDDGYGI